MGDQLDYELIVANVGSAPAYVIDLQDDMGLGRLRPISGTGANLADWNFNVPAGWNCALSGTPIALDCTFAGPLAGNGALATITYSALPPHADDLVSHNTQPWNPELVENKAATPSYYGVAAPGPSDWQYSFGTVLTQTWIFTPQPETAVRWSECPASVLPGGQTDVIGYFGNGDRQDYSNNHGDVTLLPWPELSMNPDAGLGFAPVATITVPASVQWIPGAVMATGPYTGSPVIGNPFGGLSSATFVPFSDPDVVTNNADGTTTLEWNTLSDFPHSDNNDGQQHFRDELIIQVAVDVIDPNSSNRIESTLDFVDGDGESTRSENVSNPWTYHEADFTNCPGAPGPAWSLTKTPDRVHNVRLFAGDISNFTIRTRINTEELTNGTYAVSYTHLTLPTICSV